jgi:methionyl-tRNA formyltransferase
VVILFFGTPEFAVPSLDAIVQSPHRVAAVITQPDKPRGRGQRVSAAPVKARAEALGIPVWQPEKLRDEAFLEQMRALGADLGVVAAYGKILPESLLQIPRMGMINVHASLLPHYRGAAPIQRAIMHGETRTGVTIMRVVKALDAGEMILSDSIPIGPDESGGELEARLAALGARLLLPTIAQLARGTAIEEPQDDSQATYASRILKTDGLIAWDRPAWAIHDQVRALSPWPHAYTFLDGARYVLHRTRPHTSIERAAQGLTPDVGQPVTTLADRPAQARAGQPDTIATATAPANARADANANPARAGSSASPGSAPGTILPATRGRLLVQADAGTVIEVLSIQEEGRRVLPVRDFLAGRPLPAGARFTAGGDQA